MSQIFRDTDRVVVSIFCPICTRETRRFCQSGESVSCPWCETSGTVYIKENLKGMKFLTVEWESEQL